MNGRLDAGVFTAMVFAAAAYAQSQSISLPDGGSVEIDIQGDGGGSVAVDVPTLGIDSRRHQHHRP